jgi:DNA-cytosine methyltransferase
MFTERKPLKVLSLFSGVGGFDMGLTNTGGMETVFMCEIDKHARSVLDYHWPDTPKWDDVTTLTGQYILDHCDGVDVVAWGSPCQDLSIAGKRAGLTGERSGLFHHGIRIIKELRELSNGKYPTWSIWENVAGALSSNKGADFGEVLYEMDEAGACFSEWSLLDAQYFGVPQRRRRVFVISCFDSSVSERCPEPLLPVSESLSGDSAKGKPKGKATSGEVAASVGAGSESFRMRGFGDYADDDTFSAIKARDWKDHTDLIVEPTTFVLDRAAFNQGENAWYGPVIEESTTVPPLVARGPHAVGQDSPVTYSKSRRAQSVDDHETWVESDVAPTLNIFDVGDIRATTAIVEAVAYSIREDAGANTFSATEIETARSLQALQPSVQSHHAQTFITQPLLLDGRRVDDVRVYTEPVQTLQERMGTGGNNVPVVAQEQEWKAYDEYNDTLNEIHHSLRAGTKQSTGVLGYPTLIVRRLTPLECERLMGWPDGHTSESTNGTVSDTQRYKMCGNGVASPVAEWIARHIIDIYTDTI